MRKLEIKQKWQFLNGHVLLHNKMEIIPRLRQNKPARLSLEISIEFI